jgi:magnesium-transporting ATPase (P-type)
LPSAAKTQGVAQEIAFVKGAPREVLELCTQLVGSEGSRRLENCLREQILNQLDQYARRGLRVMAFAYRLLPPRSGAYTSSGVERDLTFLGLMAMLDPARPEVAEAISTCKQAGIRMVMITGDYGLTAETLARRIGMIGGDGAFILTGAELDAMDDERLQALLPQEVVYARMAPEHKLRLVAAFQSLGEVVAVTGDGVNDAPALRKADVGVAMGVTGSDVAKEAADVILVNDNFATIVDAIQEGRAVYDNLRKFMTYIFSSNVPEILPFLLTALFNIPLALTVRQILAIDLITDMLPGLALGSEKPEPDILERPPRRRNQPLIDRGLLLRAFLWLGPIEAVLAFSGFFLVIVLDAKNAILPLTGAGGEPILAWAASLLTYQAVPTNLVAVTIFHAGVVMAQAGNAFAARSETHRGRSLGWFSNPFLILGVGIEIGLIMLLVYFRPLARIFQHGSLQPIFWLWLGLYPIILYSTEKVRKSIVRKRQNNHHRSGW